MGVEDAIGDVAPDEVTPPPPAGWLEEVDGAGGGVEAVAAAGAAVDGAGAEVGGAGAEVTGAGVDGVGAGVDGAEVGGAVVDAAGAEGAGVEGAAPTDPPAPLDDGDGVSAERTAAAFVPDPWDVVVVVVVVPLGFVVVVVVVPLLVVTVVVCAPPVVVGVVTACSGAAAGVAAEAGSVGIAPAPGAAGAIVGIGRLLTSLTTGVWVSALASLCTTAELGKLSPAPTCGVEDGSNEYELVVTGNECRLLRSTRLWRRVRPA